jgi:hypothetical protein
MRRPCKNRPRASRRLIQIAARVITYDQRVEAELSTVDQAARA